MLVKQRCDLFCSHYSNNGCGQVHRSPPLKHARYMPTAPRRTPPPRMPECFPGMPTIPTMKTDQEDTFSDVGYSPPHQPASLQIRLDAWHGNRLTCMPVSATEAYHPYTQCSILPIPGLPKGAWVSKPAAPEPRPVNTLETHGMRADQIQAAPCDPAQSPTGIF